MGEEPRDETLRLACEALHRGGRMAFDNEQTQGLGVFRSCTVAVFSAAMKILGPAATELT